MNDNRSLTDQLRDLYALANKFGLYDAADFVRAAQSRHLSPPPYPDWTHLFADGVEVAGGSNEAMLAARRLFSGECEAGLRKSRRHRSLIEQMAESTAAALMGDDA